MKKTLLFLSLFIASISFASTRETVSDIGTLSSLISAPQSLTATGKNQSVILSWSANNDHDLQKYNIYWGTSANPATLLTGVNKPDTTYTHTGLTNGIIYYYRITAVDDDGNESGYSNEVSVMPNSLFSEATSISLPGVSGSSVAWGDYDNDGDLDILLTGSGISKIYTNDGIGGFVEATSILLMGVSSSSASWGDYDNDGDLDILLMGLHDNLHNEYHTKIYTNNGMGEFFEENPVQLPDRYEGSVAWFDYDNDGDLDVFMAGRYDYGSYGQYHDGSSFLFLNEGNGNFHFSISFDKIFRTAFAYGDYDNDGDLDILFTGTSGLTSRYYQPRSKIYTNDGFGNYTLKTSLQGVRNGSVAWGDYDNDGDLDILLTGRTANSGYGAISKIYTNDGVGGFTENTSIHLIGVGNSSVAWGDYDNDDDLDILLTGSTSNNEKISKIYTNDGAGGFTENTSISLIGVDHSSVAWGDYDNDGDLDILLTGYSNNGKVSKIYKNNTNVSNTLPNVPINLSSVTTINKTVLSWSKTTDAETSQNGLYYNIRIGTTSGGIEIMSPMSSKQEGYRRIVEMGNTQKESQWKINYLSPGKYYWSVQTIDGIYAASEWTTENSFTILEKPIGLVATPDSLQINLAWSTNQASNIQQYRIYRSTNSPAATLIDSVFAPDTKYYDSNVSDGIIYYYRITAIDEGGNESNYSDEITSSSRSHFNFESSISLYGVRGGSVSWGDYDNDDDLDILLTGSTLNNEKISKIYTNDGAGGFTENTSISLIGVDHSSVAWGDYDNDGDLDILLTGYSNSGIISKIYTNNGNGGFAEASSISLPGVYFSSATWGDYDNDGDLDILLTGYSNSGIISKIYTNNGNGGFAEATSIFLPGVWQGSVAWGDYDNDGDLDILLTGSTSNNEKISKIYTNNGVGGFTENTSISLIGVNNSSVAWGDYDNDGDLDILLTGGTSNNEKISKIYTNDGVGGFTENTSISLIGVNNSSVAWGDYDNDGDLDIFLSGEHSYNNPQTLLYNNNGSGGFAEEPFLPLFDLSFGSVSYGDYDNDGDLDILHIGQTANNINLSIVYKNNTSNRNIIPTKPTNLFSNSSINQTTLNWDKSSDAETPQKGLTYNLRIGTTHDGNEILASMANQTNGYRRITKLGNVQKVNQFSIKNLPPDIYYWNVQAIDGAYAGSEWAVVDSFEILAVSAPKNLTALALYNRITLTWSPNTETDLLKYYIYSGTSANPTTLLDSVTAPDTSYVHSPVQSGTTYYYRITAVDSAGNESDYSNEVNAEPIPSIEVVSTNPNKNSITVTDSSQIKITFDETLQSGTVADTTVFVTGSITGRIAGTLSAANKTVTFIPTDRYNIGEKITVTLTTGIESTSGASLQNGYSFQFTIGADANPSGLLSVSKNYSVGSGSFSISLADFNRDKKADFGTANFSSNNFSLRMNDGHGSFGSGTTYSTGSSTFPYGIASAPLNANDYNDLLLSLTAQDKIKAFQNNGSGGFTGLVSVSSGDAPRGITLADLDNDGDMDAVTANENAGSVSVFTNDGAGSFTLNSEYTTGTKPYEVICGDFNEDGTLDIAVTNKDSDNFSILLSTGNLSFAAAVNYAVGVNPIGIETADLNNDSHLDLIIANSGSANLSILLGNGAGTFTSANTVTAGNSPRGVLAGDFDGDGDLDIACTNSEDDNVSLFSNSGTASFSFVKNLTAGDFPSGLKAADIDGDGYLDIAAANANSGNVTVYRNRPAPQVVSVYPSADVDSISVRSEIKVWFDMPIDSASVTNASFLVVGSSSGVHSGAFGFTENYDTLIFTPATSYGYLETVTVTLTTGIKDRADGVPLQQEYQFSFQTEPDYKPVLSFTGEDNYQSASVYPLEGNITTLFEYRINYSSLSNDAPAEGYPKILLDFDGDGELNSIGEGEQIMLPVDPQDTVYRDGKLYNFYTTLPLGSSHQVRYRVIDVTGDSAATENEMLNYQDMPDVLGGLPDGVVKSSEISFSNENPEPSRPFTITATVKNESDANMQDISVRFYKDDELIGEKTISFLSHRTETDVSLETAIDESGFFAIRVVIDENNQIAEGNELNNVALRPLLVGDAPITGTISVASQSLQSFAFSPFEITGRAMYNGVFGGNQPVAGGEVTITFDGRNYTTVTNSNGYFKLHILAPNVGVYNPYIEVTDFRLTGNTNIEVNVVPLTGPDVALGEINVSNSNPTAGELVTVSFNALNRGTTDLHNVKIIFVKDGILTDNVTIPNLPVNGTENIEFITTFTGEGRHLLFAKADPFNEISEICELNNTSQKEVIVIPQQPDLVVRNIIVNSSVLVNVEHSFNVRVQNIGGVDVVSPFTVKLFANGVEIASGEVNSLQAGQSTTVNLSAIFTTEGVKTINAIVDYGNAISENDESNNEFSKVITVQPPRSNLTFLQGFMVNSPANPAVGDNVQISVTAINNGDIPSSSTQVKFTVAGTNYSSTVSVPSLDINEEIVLDAGEFWIPQAETTYVSKAEIDFANGISEINELDNAISKAIVVGYSADLALANSAAILSDDFYAEDGEEVHLSAMVHNNGTLLATGIVQFYYETVSGRMLYINGASVTVSPADSAVSGTVDFTLPFAPVKIIAKVTNSQPTDYESNNNQTEVFIGDSAPVISGLSNLAFNEDSSLTINLNDFVFDGGDADEDLNWSIINGANISASINTSSNIATLTATSNFFGSEQLTFYVFDPEGEADTALVNVQVYPINDSPVLSGIPDINFNEDESFILRLNSYVTDVDTDTGSISFTANILSAEGMNSLTSFTKSKDSLGRTVYSLDVDDLIIAIDNSTNIAEISASADSSGLFVVAFTATDDSSASDSDTLNITVNSVNDPPVVQNEIEDKILTEDFGEIVIVQDLNSVFGDIDSDTLSFSVTGSDANIQSEIIGAGIKISSKDNKFGLDTLIVSASDESFTVIDTFTVTILPINDSPVVSGIPDIVFPEDNSFTLDLDQFVSDVDNDTSEITWSYNFLSDSSKGGESAVIGNKHNKKKLFSSVPLKRTPHGLKLGESDSLIVAIDETTHILSVQATANFNGLNIKMELTATDDSLAFGVDTTNISVIAVNDLPFVQNAISDFGLDEDFGDFTLIQNLNFNFDDLDNDELTFTIQSSENNLITELNQASIIVHSKENLYGSDTVVVFADDGEYSVSDTFVVSVSNIDDAPVVSGIPDIVFPEDSSFTLDLDQFVSDVDNDTSEITWSYNFLSDSSKGGEFSVIGNKHNKKKLFSSVPLKRTPHGLKLGESDSLIVAIDETTHILSVQATANFNGLNIKLELTATDDSLAFGVDTTNISVIAVNDPPFVQNAISDFGLDEDFGDFTLIQNLNLNFDDLDNDELTFTIQSSENNLITELNQASIIVHSKENLYGSDTVVVFADDGEYFVSDTFVVSVRGVDDAPVVSWIPDIVFPEDSSFTLDLDQFVSDVDNDSTTLTWSFYFPDSLKGNSNNIGNFCFSNNSKLKTGKGESILSMRKSIEQNPNNFLLLLGETDSLTVNIDENTHIVSISATPNFTGINLPITFVVEDSSSLFDSDTTSISIIEINDPPIITDVPPITVNEDDSTLVELSYFYQFISDIETPDSLLGMNFANTVHTRIVRNENSSVWFISNVENYFGQDTLLFSVYDNCDTTSSNLIINIESVNDIPVFIGLPDSISFAFDTTYSINLWEHTEDVETEDSLLVFTFLPGDTSVMTIYNQATGVAEIGATSGYTGETLLQINAFDEENVNTSRSIVVTVKEPVGITEFGNELPKKYILYQNYPNPFNPSTVINFALPKPGIATIKIYNIQGKEVATLINKEMSAGYHSVIFSSTSGNKSLSSGVYFYRFISGNFVAIKKMLLIK